MQSLLHMSTPLDRRRFLSASAVIGARALLGAPLAAPRRGADALTVALLLPRAPDDYARAARLGAQFGAEEGARTAALFGRVLAYAEHSHDGADDARGVARLAADRGARVLVGGFDAESCAAIAEVTAGAGAVFLNVGRGDDALRGARCAASMFHVAPSDAMRADVLAAARAADGAIPPDAAVESWHPSLERFGAAQLTDRFRARHGVAMTSGAWAGWFAVKAVTDLALRDRANAALAPLLAAPAAQFDGHKGMRLSFRPWDRQLRQPLYVVHDGRVLAELPSSRGASPGTPARDRLDAFGTPASRTTCALPARDDS